MRKALLTLLFLVVTAFAFDASIEFGHALSFMTFRTHGTVSSVISIPTLVAGSFAPKGQTPAMPSVSTEPVRCGPQVDNAGNSIWGVGCNHTTGFCTAPTTGSPYQPCQPPQMLVTTGGTGNGTTAQILYTSYAGATYPAGEAIIVGQPGGTHQATQANWNTPNSHANGFATSASNALCSASGPSVTLTLNDSASANPYAITGPNSTVYINGVTGSVANQYQSFGWTTGNPNGMFPLVAVGGSTGAWTITYCTGVQVTGTYLPNADGYSGIVTSPYIALAGSNCGIGGNPFACQVSFLNSHACASSCVSATTQFVAGQFDDLIINHHFGEQVPLSEQNSVVEPCAITSHISGPPANPAYSMYAELDGGAFVETGPITDPRGTGASGLAAPPKKVYCVQFNASAVADGEHEVSWVGCPIVGYCGRLSSTQAIDAASGSSTFFKANNHALAGSTILGVVASPDTQFPVFDWTQSTLRSLNGQGSGPNISSISMATGFATFNFTASPIVGQFKPGSTVGISGMVTGNSCAVSSGSQNGSALTLNLTGTCNFPTNSTVNIAGISAIPNGNLINSCPITGGSIALGVATLTYSGVCSFPMGEQFTVSGITAPSALNGLQTITVSAAGTISFATAATGAVTLGIGPSITANNFTWSGTIVTASTGGTCPGTCQIQVPSISTMSFTTGGTVTANLNGQCVVSSSSSGQIVCPTLADASTTRVSGGSISSTANLFCAPGGNGDDPAPYDPAGGTEVQQFFPDSFQLVPYVAAPATCGLVAGQTGCFGANCGRLPTQQETLWVTRFEAGIDEREVFNSIMPKLETGSLFIWTDAGATIKRKNVWVDSWNQSAVKTGCYSSATPCGDLSHALYALQATSAITNGTAGNQTLTNQAVTNCLVFSNATNISGAIPFYDGEPVENISYDGNTSPQLSQFGLYWVVGAGSGETGSATGVTLAATPGGPCITDTASGIFGGLTNVASTAWLVNDVGFDNIYLACNASLGCTAWNPSTQTGNPETYDWKVATTAAATAPFYARSSYLNIGPDTTNGVTGHQVSVLNGTGNFFINAVVTAQGGRIHKTADSIDNDLALTPAVALGPTLPITTVTGGSLATCPAPNAAHQCETLTFTAHKNPATAANDGSMFQAPTATNPLGQSIIVSGVVSSPLNNCAVTSASLVSGVSFTLNFTTGGACATFIASNTVNITGIVVSGGNGVAWNGTNLLPLSVTASSITLATTSTASYVSGGAIVFNSCGVSSASSVSGVSFTLNFVTGGGCAALTAGNAVNIAGIALTTNTTSWNGNNLIPLSVTASSITMATTSTGIYSSGGTISAGWNCGTTIASSCGLNGTTQLSSNLVGATATSATFINDNAAGTWVSGGKITPTDLVAEFAPGTLTTTPCATDGIANDTHLFTTCLGSNSLVGGIPQWVGTNATSFPISLNGTTPAGTNSTISQNSNCLYVTATGDNPTAIGAQTIQSVIPGTGSNNDVAILSFNLALSVSYYAYNQCDTLHFENTVFAPTGSVTDMWYDSETIYGPGPYSDHTGVHGGPVVNAAFYQTNGTRQSTTLAFSGATYAWGGHSQYGITDCIVATQTDISIECNNNGQTVLPLALGGNLNPDGSQWAFVSQSSNSAGANVQCSGVDCVSTTSVTFKVPQGSIPYFASPGWGLFVTCNMPTSGPPFNTSPATSLIGNSLPITYLNNDTNPAVVTTSIPAGLACNISSHPAIQFLNFDHIDFDFNTFGQSLLPGGIRGTWQTFNSVIQENISAPSMGTMEGWAYQGGRLFNFALEDMYAGLSQPPSPTQLPYVTIGQGEVVGVYNIILRNDFFGTYVTGTTAAYLQPWQDFYVISDSGGTGQTNFPNNGSLDWKQTSFWDATSDIFAPLVGDAAVGGAQTNFTVWPTGTRGVDPATGLPNVASAPFYNSMTAAPWYGILGDTGLGTQ